jgi:hypothetical protein
MGIFKKDELMLDFNGVKTENISSTIPYLNKLDTQAKMLVNQLGPMSKVNNKSLILFNESDNYDMYRLFEKSNGVTNNDNNFSETSPFISSDIYKILNKKSHKSHKSHKSQRGGGDDDEVEESSTTSSDSSDSDKKKKKMESSEMDDSEAEEEVDMSDMSEMSDMSAGSYLSSSAHTDGVESESASNTMTATASSASASVSASFSSQHQRRHKNRHVMSDSVNTSDINIISVDDN